jgi:hypothetical protein
MPAARLLTEHFEPAPKDESKRRQNRGSDKEPKMTAVAELMTAAEMMTTEGESGRRRGQRDYRQCDNGSNSENTLA